MATAPTLTPRAWSPDDIAAFDQVCQVNPWGTLQNAGELLHGCYLFDYTHNGQAALVALHRSVHSGGVGVHVQAVVSLGEPLQARQFMGAVENTALTLGGDMLTLMTQHPALAASAQRWGGVISGAVIRKALKVH